MSECRCVTGGFPVDGTCLVCYRSVGVQVFADDPDSPETWGQEADGLTEEEREIERRALLRLKVDDATRLLENPAKSEVFRT